MKSAAFANAEAQLSNAPGVTYIHAKATISSLQNLYKSKNNLTEITNFAEIFIDLSSFLRKPVKPVGPVIWIKNSDNQETKLVTNEGE